MLTVELYWVAFWLSVVCHVQTQNMHRLNILVFIRLLSRCQCYLDVY